MAERIKTIEWGFETLPGPLSASTGLIVAQWVPELLYLPETASRVFESVYLKINWLNTSSNTTLRANLNSFNVQTKLDGAATYTNNRLTCSITDTGENFNFETWCDATNDFNTHFLSGTEKGLTATFAFTQSNGAIGGLINPVNLTCKAIVTYKYDDTGVAKKIKTIRIPLQGNTGSQVSASIGDPIGPTHSVLDINPIPAFDIFLPESGIVYKNFFIEINSSISVSTITAQTCSFNIRGSDVPNSFGIGVMSFSSPSFVQGSTNNIYNLFKRNDLTESFSGTKSLYFLQSVFVATRWHYHQPVCYLTYEYDENLSSRILNSVIFPIELNIENQLGSANQPTSGAWTKISFLANEPGNIETKNCAFLGNISTTTTLSPLFDVIEQTQQTFPFQGNLVTSQKRTTPFSVRFDNHSGSLRPSNFKITNGNNNINLMFRNTASSLRCVPYVEGMLCLNYISDKHTNGSDCHNKTIFKLNITPQQTNPVFAVIFTGTNSASIPENNYYLNSFGSIYKWHYNALVAMCPGTSLTFDKQENIFNFSGCYTNIKSVFLGSEMCFLNIWDDYSSFFRKFKQDAKLNNLIPTLSRTFSIYSHANTLSSSYAQSELIYTYNSISYDIFGRIQNLTGANSSSNNVYLYSKKTGDCLAVTQASGDGFYKFTYFDKTDDLFVGSPNGYVVDSYHVRNSNNRLYVLTTSGSTYGPNSLLGSKWSEAPMYNSMYMFPYRSDDYPSLSNGDQLITWETALSYLGATGTIRG